MNIRKNLRVFIKSRNKQIICRVKWVKGEIDFYIGYYGDETKWDKANQLPLRNTTHTVGKHKTIASEISRAIGGYKNAIEDVFKYYEGVQHIPTKEEVKLMVNERLGKVKVSVENKNFFTVWDEYIEVQKKQKNWVPNVTKKFISLKNILRSFSPDLSFQNLTENKLLALRDWFVEYRTEDKNGKLQHKYRNTTINKYFEFLGWFLRWAAENGMLIHREVLKFNTCLKEIPTPVSFLNIEELMQFYNYQYPKKDGILELSRDMFCFMAFTSIRYSDLKSLCWSDIHGKIMEIVTEKTDERLQIELNDYALEILKKYKKMKQKGNHVFPPLSNQKLNSHLKEAALLAQLTKTWVDEYYIGNDRIREEYKFYQIISSHDGRRTFICCSLAFGIPHTVVMKWTGHRDYASMKPYIEISDKTKAAYMGKWNF
ncbi:site-specific integrase [Bacteroides thetaiotaomicron]|jgi:integrase|uniref:site-specific integrase n=1 Tax=Bacteroides thetaiotaomicron TaxID=818 RepID=UPI0021652CE5|nr:site-specific integrase [Bacteroides thetaiotaomicron]MCS2715257.1 site-specific integrase [Bacteroides thetaiotaomicron]MCS2875557.1 site-specific integrase [Bacteroides thetaiotaomicron]